MKDKGISQGKAPIAVGWREWSTLPDLGIKAIKAKLDTGARTSTLHTFFVEPYDKDGKEMIRFGLHPFQRRKDYEVTCSAEVLDRRVILDSGGKRDHRYIIRTTLSLAGLEWPIEVSLTNREDLRFRFLVGREAMKNRLMVDPGKSYVLGRPGGKVPRTPKK